MGVSTVSCREARAGHSARWCSLARHAALHGDTLLGHVAQITRDTCNTLLLWTRGTAADLHSGTRHTWHVAAVARSGRGSPHSIQLPRSSATSMINIRGSLFCSRAATLGAQSALSSLTTVSPRLTPLPATTHRPPASLWPRRKGRVSRLEEGLRHLALVMRSGEAWLPLDTSSEYF